MTWNEVVMFKFDDSKCFLQIPSVSEVKEWTLVSKKSKLVHEKEKMSVEIELSGKMGWGDQELSRSTEFQNFEVIVKSIEVSFR